MYASRNIALCTKDCVCLMVCPTGATDTENGQIDKNRCIDGCRLCVDACPSHAICLVPERFAEPVTKDAGVADELVKLAESKVRQETAFAGLADASSSAVEQKVLKALRMSARILSEDCVREAGYMSPHGRLYTELLEKIRAGNESDPSFPNELVERLLS